MTRTHCSSMIGQLILCPCPLCKLTSAKSSQGNGLSRTAYERRSMSKSQSKLHLCKVIGVLFAQEGMQHAKQLRVRLLYVKGGENWQLGLMGFLFGGLEGLFSMEGRRSLPNPLSLLLYYSREIQPTSGECNEGKDPLPPANTKHTRTLTVYAISLFLFLTISLLPFQFWPLRRHLVSPNQLSYIFLFMYTLLCLRKRPK